jgi:hypothetical protein
MANQCAFRKEFPIGYAYARTLINENEICKGCPCAKQDCSKCANLTSGNVQAESLFYPYLMRLTGFTQAELVAVIEDEAHRKKVNEFNRQLKRLREKRKH